MNAAKARLVFIVALALSGCRAGPPARSTTPALVAEPTWEGLLDPVPDLLLVVRPRALRRDAVYGPLLGRAIELARQHAKIVTSATTLEAIEGADEVIVGLRDLRKSDFVVIVRGIPAEVDPASLVDETGRPLWTATSSGAVRELSSARNGSTAPAVAATPSTAPAVAATPSSASDEDEGTTPDASLFELPGRTWVIATGSARERARMNLSHEALATTTTSATAGGPNSMRSVDSDFDPQAVAIVRLSGPGLVQRIRALRAPGLLAPVGHELGAVTVVLLSGTDALVRATFSYRTADAAQAAEATMRETISALSAAKSQSFAWLRAARTQTLRSSVVLVTPLPRELLDAMRADPGGG